MRTARPFLALLLAAALAAPMSPARAAMIGAEDAAAGSPAELERAKVQAFFDRSEVRERLQLMGVSGLNAGTRVAAMTDAEVHELAQRIDTLPTGGALSDRDILIIILIAVIVAIIV